MKLQEAGIDYRGYLPNLEAPTAYAQSKLALHLPRNLYQNQLGGIPTIRVFEALACGATLLCSPWQDRDLLFRSGEDFVVLPDGHLWRKRFSISSRTTTRAVRSVTADCRLYLSVTPRGIAQNN